MVRLDLQPLGPADLAELHAIYADAGTWQHYPAGRHTLMAQTRQIIEFSLASWRTHGLGPWAIRLQEPLGPLLPGTLVGNCGVGATPDDVWNLGYRLAPAAWGHSIATDVARQAIAAAHEASSGMPVTARVLASNPGSVRVLVKAGLTLAWRGSSPPDDAGPGAHGRQPGAPGASPPGPDTIRAERLIFADRALTPALLAALIARG